MQFPFLHNSSFLLTVALAVVMLIYNIKTNKNILFLFVFLVTAAFIQFLHQNIVFGGSARLLAITYHNGSPLVFLTGPSIYLFFRKLVHPGFRLRKIHLLHLLPFFIQLILVIPYLLTPFAYKLDIAQHLIQSPASIFQLDLKLAYPNLADFLFKLGFNIVYVILSFVLLYRHHRSLSRQKRFNWNQHDRNLIWMWFILFILLIFITLMFISINGLRFAEIINKRESFLGTLATIIRIIFVLIPASILVFPHVLTEFTIKQVERAATENTPEGNTQLENEIRNFMEEHKPFLDQKFNRSDLCKALNISLQQMQDCLKTSSSGSFIGLKNEYRILHSIELLQEEHSRGYTLEAIASLSGFSTYSSFFNAFKEIKGMTPKQWLKEPEKD